MKIQRFENFKPDSTDTKSLLKHMRTPGMPIERVFKNVRVEVVSATERRQVPWENSSLMGDFYFIPKSGKVPEPVATPVPVQTPAPVHIQSAGPPQSSSAINSEYQNAIEETETILDEWEAELQN